MIWLVWRRQRVALLFALGLAALVAIAAVVGRSVGMEGVRDLGALNCLDRAQSAPSCRTTEWSSYRSGLGQAFQLLQAAQIGLPLVAGVAAGAGLFGREVERGTHVFALSQHVSRLRWWASGLLVAGLPVAVAVGLSTAVAAVAVQPFNDLFSADPLDPVHLGTTGVLPAFYTLLAFGTAAAAGLVLRNVVAAIAVTAVVQGVVVAAVVLGGRVEYLPTVELRTPTDGSTSDGIPEDALYADVRFVDERDRDVVPPTSCSVQPYAACLRAAGIVDTVVDYHPASRYWPFQAIESGILLALFAGTLGAGLWGLRRRVH